MKNPFIFSKFDYCRNGLGWLLPHELKILKFLTCTTACTDFDESHKPNQALYSNRQVRNIYESFKNLLITGIGWCQANSTFKRAFPDKGLVSCALRLSTISTTNKTEFPLTCILRDRSETISDRQPKLKDKNESQSLTLGGEGLRLVFVSLSFSISFSLAGRLALIV